MIAPMLALMGLICTVSLPYVAYTRVKATSEGQIPKGYWRTKNSGGKAVPRSVEQTGAHVANVFEFPTIFYALALLVIVTKIGDDTFDLLGWAYVVSRVVHAVIHLSYNNIVHRFLAFCVSHVVLCIILARVALALL